MLPEQRQLSILSKLAESGAVRVTTLARDLGVTEETIRRDLEKLDREGRLARTHGGALPRCDVSQDLPFEHRRTAHHEEKERIARYALRHIEEDDVIALDASSTVHEIARVLPDIPLTVVTNALPATVELMSRTHVRVMSTGGFLDLPSRSWVGSFAERALERVNINKLFLSSKGVDSRRGLSEVDDTQARVKRRMMDLAEEKILLVDHSKFGGRGAVHLGTTDEIDVLIADNGVSAEVLRNLRSAGLCVELVD